MSLVLNYSCVFMLSDIVQNKNYGIMFPYQQNWVRVYSFRYFVPMEELVNFTDHQVLPLSQSNSASNCSFISLNDTMMSVH